MPRPASAALLVLLLSAMPAWAARAASADAGPVVSRSTWLRGEPHGRATSRVRGGHPVEVLGRVGDWLHVRTNGTAVGWLRAEDVDGVSEQPEAAPESPVVEREPAIAPEPAMAPEPVPVLAARPAFEPPAPAMHEPAHALAAPIDVLMTPGGPLRVRLTPLPLSSPLRVLPSEQAPLVRNVEAGTGLQFLKRSGDFVQVRTASGASGWIAMSALRGDVPAAPAPWGEIARGTP